MNMDYAPTILYGAGKMAQVEINNLRKKNLVCFVDKDPLKWNTEYLGLPVMKIEDAKTLYGGDAYVYLTLSDEFKLEACEFLLKHGIKKDNIINYVEKYYGCHLLETQLVITHEHLYPCCFDKDTMNKQPIIKWRENMEDTIDQYIQTRDSLIYSIKNKETSGCLGCKKRKNSFFAINKTIQNLMFGMDLPCQLSCTYCIQRNASKGVDKKTAKFINEFDYALFMKHLYDKELITDNTVVHLAGGEISIYPRKNELYDIVRNHTICVSTNAVIFDEQLAALSVRPGKDLNLCISVDAGTRETYKLVKGMDVFDKIWINAKKYMDSGANIALKYVFLPENSNETDVRGFIRNIFEFNVKLVIVSFDVYNQKLFNDKQTCLIADMINGLKKGGVETLIADCFINDASIDKLNVLLT